MAKAIETKWLPCTNTKPSRIVSFAEGGNRHTQSTSCDDLTTLQQEASAAYVLARRLDWQGGLIGKACGLQAAYLTETLFL